MDIGLQTNVAAYNGHWATEIIVAHMHPQRLRLKKIVAKARVTTFVMIFFIA